MLFPFYESVHYALVGGKGKPPLVLNSSIEVQLFLKSAHKRYWATKQEDVHNPLLPILHQEEYEYDDVYRYVSYHRNLRMKDSTGIGLTEFLNLDYSLAIHILNEEIKRAEKEMEEERKRKKELKPKTGSKGLDERLGWNGTRN